MPPYNHHGYQYDMLKMDCNSAGRYAQAWYSGKRRGAGKYIDMYPHCNGGTLGEMFRFVSMKNMLEQLKI